MMLTPLELDIMKVVWRQSPIAVRDVQSGLRPGRNLAYTTVMTIMDRLYHKGFLTRVMRARRHLYEPAIAYAEVRAEALDFLIGHFFDGRRDKLEAFLRGAPDGPAAEPDREQPPPTILDETLL